jgi:ABC-type multidrug transport system fused ATPase/permease subunit
MGDGYAAKCAQATLREAEQVVETLEKLLRPADAEAGAPIAVYLSDPLGALPDDQAAASPDLPESLSEQQVGTPGGDDGAIIVRVIRPEAPGEPIVLPLTHLLARRWFGPDSVLGGTLLDGVAGVVAARIGKGPSIEAANQWVRSERAARRSVSVVGRARLEPPANGRARELDLGATSFVAFLLEANGPTALRQFLADYDPNRRDQAAVAAFQRPLGTLEETWLSGLEQRGGDSAFRAFFRHLMPLLRPYWRRELEVLGLMILGLSYGLVLPLSGKYLIDTIIPSGSIGRLTVFILVLAVIYCLNLVVGMRRAYVNNWINQHVLIGMQERMFAKLQRLSHDYYGRAKVGDIMARFSGDITVVQQAMGQVVGVGVYLALSAIAASITLLVLNWLLGLVVLLVVPLFALSYVALGSRLEAASYERQKRMGQAVAILQENVSAYAVIRAFGLEERAVNSYRAVLQGVLKAMLRLVVFAALFETSTALATTMGQLVVLGVGGTLVIKGHLTIGTLLAFIGLLPALFTPVASLANVGQSVQMAAGSLKRIDEVLDEPITIDDAPSAPPLPPVTRDIALEHISFSYDGERPILDDLSLVIEAGSHVAVVGPSGSGKSTIVNLLLRFWDPDQGRVLFDGRDAREVTLASLRGQMSLVFQDTFVFDTTVRENIALARPSASDSDVVSAARAAQLDDYISSLPNGYDTVLGERGVRMSGGQRQRLAIARALLRDPRILILDEATSALDMTTEREIIEALAELARGRTTISITHRLSLAATADRIVVLESGRIAEQGTHSDLVRAGGLYQRLYDEQTGRGAGTDLGAGVERGRALIGDRLRTIPLFAGLSGESLEAMARQLTMERYGAGEVVVRQGEPGDVLYIVSRGETEVVLEGDDGERRLNTLGGGDYFGEMALLTSEPRVATVRTTQPSELFSLTRADFLALLAREPAISRTIGETIASRRTALVQLTAVPA